MKRRSFIYLLLSALPMRLIAATVWAVKGKLGYSDVAPESAKRFKKSCDTCKYLYRDETIKGAGICQHPAIKAAAKAEEVYVKKTGWCKMWQKDG